MLNRFRFAAVLSLLFWLGLVDVAKAEPRLEMLEAARLGDESKAKLLLLRGVDPNIREAEHGPVIVFAARQKSFSVVRLLALDPRTELNATNKHNETALMHAAIHGDLQTVKFLIEKGAEVNRPGWSPLHYAASGGHPEVIKLLLDNHAYIDAASPGNVTPLMLTARHEHVSAAQLLLNEGADPTLRSDQGLSVVDYWKRVKDPKNAEWMQKQADLFLKKYGTKENPVLAKPEPESEPEAKEKPSIDNRTGSRGSASSGTPTNDATKQKQDDNPPMRENYFQ